MTVQAQFGGLAGCLPYGGLVGEQMMALKDYGAQYNCAGVGSGAQSELTCNGGCGGCGGVVASRKRGREAELDQYVSSSSAALLPIPGMHDAVLATQPLAMCAVSRVMGSGMMSTSGRPAVAASGADALVSELCRQGAEIDALVRAECDRLRAGMELARKRQCLALVRSAARRLAEKEAELEAARRRAAELEERLRQAAAEAQAWCNLAHRNEAVAAGLRATLDQVLLCGVPAGGCHAPADEGFGESDPAFSAPPAAADDAQSCCFVATKDEAADTATASSTVAGKWACKACGEGEASVVVLPCRHLSLCKACEPRLDACPVCLAGKNASIHIVATN